MTDNISLGFRPGISEVVQDYADQHDALTLATSRLQAWQDWTARILSPEVLAETASVSALVAETDRDPHVPYRAAVLGAFASQQRAVVLAHQSAAALEDLARHYKVEVDRILAIVEKEMKIPAGEMTKDPSSTTVPSAAVEALAGCHKYELAVLRGAIEAMLLASEHTDPREAIIEAAAKVGAYLDFGTHDNPDTRVRWRLDDRKDGDA